MTRGGRRTAAAGSSGPTALLVARWISHDWGVGEGQGSWAPDVVRMAEEPVYESVECPRCGHSYPVVSRGPEDDRPGLCEECRGEMFATEHAHATRAGSTPVPPAALLS